MEEKFYDRLIFISVYRATDNGFKTFISSNVSKFSSKNPQSPVETEPKPPQI